MLSKEERLQYGEVLRLQMKEREQRKKLEQLEKRGRLPGQQQQAPQQMYGPNYVPRSEPSYYPVQVTPQHYMPDPYRQPPIYEPMPTPQSYPNNPAPSIPTQNYEQSSRMMVVPQEQQRTPEVQVRQRMAYAPEQVYQPEIAPPPQAYQNGGQRLQYAQAVQRISEPLPFIPSEAYQHQQQYQMNINQNAQQNLNGFGRRGVLKLDNMTQQQLDEKQKKKLQMQRELRQQMEQVKQRQENQKKRIQQLELQKEQEDRRYIEEQNRRAKEEEMKKKLKEKGANQENMHNAQMAAKNKKRIIQMHEIQLPNTQANRKAPIQNQPNSPSPNLKHQKTSEESITVQSNLYERQKQMHRQQQQIALQQARRKQAERRQEEERKNRAQVQQVYSQIESLKAALNNQNQLFRFELDKVKLEAQKTRLEKQRSQQELNRVKQELRKKMEEENTKLNEALRRNDPRNFEYHTPVAPPSHYERPRMQPVVTVDPPRQPPLPKYPVRQTKEQTFRESASQALDPGLNSLPAVSQHIPINLGTNSKLTMSRIQDYAIDKNGLRQTQNKKNSLPAIEQEMQDASIYEDAEDDNPIKREFKKHLRSSMNFKADNDDQLDRFLKQSSSNPHSNKISGQNYQAQTRQEQSLGNMTSVNSDITKQIEKILLQQRSPYAAIDYGQASISKGDFGNNRPPSQLSNAGKLALGNHGYALEGFTLGTDNNNNNTYTGTRNSFDLDHINKMNDKRLNKLRDLGIDSVSSREGDLGKLDSLLGKYDQ